jgi:5-oxoprolinase (ATP-hydrolysing)
MLLLVIFFFLGNNRCSFVTIVCAQVLEFRFPLRVEAFAIRKGSGGAGKHKGGDGIERRLKFLAPMTVGILANRREVMGGGGRGVLQVHVL